MTSPQPNSQQQQQQQQQQTQPPVLPSITPPQSTQPPQQQQRQFSFNVGGKKSSDFAAVQAYIDQVEARNAALEGAQLESQNAAREEFAKSLVQSGRILATKEADTIKLCKEMSADQFETYKSIMGDVSINPLLGQYGQQGTVPGSTANHQQQQRADHMTILRDQVALHRASGIPDEKIREFKSYKELVVLDPTAAF